MPDVISDTNGKLCVGSYHMWRLLSSPDNYSFDVLRFQLVLSIVCACRLTVPCRGSNNFIKNHFGWPHVAHAVFV